MSIFCANEVLERMKNLFNVNSFKDLAIALEIGSSTVSGWNVKNTVPLDVLLNVAEQKKVSLDWLIKGEQQTSLDEMETELLKRFKQLDFSQKLQVFNGMGNGNSNTSININGNSGNYVGGDVKIG